LGKLECAAASAAQTKLRATKGAQLRLKTYVRRNARILGRTRVQELGRAPETKMAGKEPARPAFVDCRSVIDGNFRFCRPGFFRLEETARSGERRTLA